MPLSFTTYVTLACAIFSLTGCTMLLPSEKATVESPWNTFDDAKAAYDRIIPGKSTLEELKGLGFDFDKTPNLKVSNYLDIAAMVQSIRFEDLDPGLQACLRAKTDCNSYVFEPRRTHTVRIGSFWLDFLNFRRKSHETGWQFKALIVMVNNLVTYKLWNGTRYIDELKDSRNPLGPFQGANSLLLNLL